MSDPLNSVYVPVIVPAASLLVDDGKESFVDLLAQEIEKRNKSVERFWGMVSEVIEDEVREYRDRLVKTVLGEGDP